MEVIMFIGREEEIKAIERIINQKGGFIFFQGTSCDPLDPVYYKEVVIEADDKEKILRELDILFGVNEATIYPDRDKVAKKIVKPKLVNKRLF